MKSITQCRSCKQPLQYSGQEASNAYSTEPAEIAVFCVNEQCNLSRFEITTISLDDAAMLLDAFAELVTAMDVTCIQCGGVDPFKCSWCKRDQNTWGNNGVRIGEFADHLIRAMFSEEQEHFFSPMSRTVGNTEGWQVEVFQRELERMRQRAQQPLQKGGIVSTSMPSTSNVPSVYTHTDRGNSVFPKVEISSDGSFYDKYYDTVAWSKNTVFKEMAEKVHHTTFKITEEEVKQRGLTVRPSWQYDESTRTYEVHAEDYPW